MNEVYKVADAMNVGCIMGIVRANSMKFFHTNCVFLNRCIAGQICNVWSV